MCKWDEYETLEELAQAQYGEALRHHGYLGLSREQFVARFEQVVAKYVPEDAPEQSRIDFGAQLSSSDLYLATACGLPTESAWGHFYSLYDVYLKRCLRQYCREPNILNDLMDDPSAELFLPDSSGRSRITSYDGRSSLRSWLRAVVANRVINEREKKANSMRSRDFPEDGPAVCPRACEWAVDACMSEPLLRDCLKEGCRSLSERERQMILNRYEEQLPLGVIARRWGVHQSTVTRILERSIVKFRNAAVRVLVEKGGIGASELRTLGSMLLDGEINTISLLSCLKCKALQRHVEQCEQCLDSLAAQPLSLPRAD